MEMVDVIVVGGSVSGAPTATWLARKGHKVLLLEKAIFPRDTNSTHFIWPRGMSYLNRLGVAETIVQNTPSFKKLEVNIEGIRLHGSVPMQAIRDRFKALHGSDEGVVDYYAGPRRYFLDNVLLDEAKRSGVDVREGVSVESLLMEGGAVKGVIAQSGHGMKIVAKARIVIGADGRMSSFANHVDARKTAVREKSTFAYYSYYAGIDKPELCIHKRGRFGTAIFPTMDRKHLVLVYGPTAWWGDFSKNPEENFLKTYEFVAPDVADLIRNAKRVEPFKAMGRMVAFHRQAWGDGWALVGDAGSFKDQWTAMGITHSLRDAELMSTYVDQVLRNERTWEDAMSECERKRRDDYDDYWNMVCDGAEMNPYSRDQLVFFHRIQADQRKVDHFIGQVGDTVPLRDQIPMEAVDLERLPASVEDYCSEKFGYHINPYLPDMPDAAAA
jgi:menaquinone-9 beta-reductase